MSQQQPEDRPRRAEASASADERERRKRSGASAAAARIGHQSSWVDQQIRVAMAKGEFDDLPGAGKPLQLGATHDPDWWIKKLVEREQITVLPMSVQLRREEAGLDERLDAYAVERDVRAALEDFNARVIAARYRAPEGPPLITMPRDVDADVEAWRERRVARLAEQRARLDAAQANPPLRRRWRRPSWRRRSAG